MRSRKNSFTLIEMLISMALVAMLLSTLSFFFYQISTLTREAEKQQKKAFRLHYAESRLASILPKAISPNDPQNDFVLFTSTGADSLFKQGSPQLLFSYDSCVNLVDPLFSNHVLALLFLDSSGNLTLATTPSPRKWEKGQPPQVVRELLLEKVEAMEFAFYVPPKQEGNPEVKAKKLPKGVTQESPEASGTYIANWKASYYRLPAIIKITLTLAEEEKSKEKLTLLFPFANCDDEILYR